MTMQEYLSIFSNVQTREVLPLIFAAILGIAIAITFYLLIRIQGTINKSKIENHQLLEMITAVNESSQKLDRETRQANIDLKSSYQDLKTQIEGLIEVSASFREDFNQLQAANQASVSEASRREEVLSHLLESNTQKQSEKLQALEEKFETFTQFTSKFETLEEKTSSLENILVTLQATTHNSQESIANLVSKNTLGVPEEILKSLQALSERLTEIEGYKTQTEALVKTTANEVENRIKQLLEAKKTKARSSKKGMSPTK